MTAQPAGSASAPRPDNDPLGYRRLHELTALLRRRCPWDIEQTHRSLRPYLIEEVYEVIDAIDDLDDLGDLNDQNGSGDPADSAAPHSLGDRDQSATFPVDHDVDTGNGADTGNDAGTFPAQPNPADAALIEELGDVLFQVELHSAIAEQHGRFSIADVTRGIADKLQRRHPHVFAAEDSDPDLDQISTNWEAIKRTEKPDRVSAFDGIAGSLPALSLAAETHRKAARAGLDAELGDGIGSFSKLERVAQDAVAEATSMGRPPADAIGQLLFGVVAAARRNGIDPETALRSWTRGFVSRARAAEATSNSSSAHRATPPRSTTP